MNEDLRAELKRRVEVDQEIRMKVIDKFAAGQPGADDPDLKRMQEIDTENTAWLSSIVEANGWPGQSLVGKDGAHAAWLLVQHAGHDAAFMRRCLDLMTEAGVEEVSPVDLGYLTDRVLLMEGKKQVYGTQYTRTDGGVELSPVEDEDGLDERRARLGMVPIAEQTENIKKVYKVPESEAKA